MINGLPGDSIGDFVKSLTHYKDEALIRMAALICVDGLLPLGPDYLSKLISVINHSGPAELEANPTFQRVRSLIPGGESEGPARLHPAEHGLGRGLDGRLHDPARPDPGQGPRQACKGSSTPPTTGSTTSPPSST